MTASSPPVRLYAGDVLALWNAELERLDRPLMKRRTFSLILFESWPAPPGLPAHRYEHDPMPLPNYPHPDRPRAGQKPFWEPDPGETREGLEKRLLDWIRSARPGRGRRGVERTFSTRRRRCGCGSGELVPVTGACRYCTFALSRAERRVCMELVAGGTLAEIAGRLGVARATVRAQVKAAYRKTGVNDRARLVALLVTEPGEDPPTRAAG